MCKVGCVCRYFDMTVLGKKKKKAGDFVYRRELTNVLSVFSV